MPNAPNHITTSLVVVQTDYTPVTADATVLVDTTTNNTVTITLPTAASSAGRQLQIKEYGGRALVLAATGDSIEEGHALELGRSSVTLLCDGTTWWQISDATRVNYPATG